MGGRQKRCQVDYGTHGSQELGKNLNYFLSEKKHTTALLINKNSAAKKPDQ